MTHLKHFDGHCVAKKYISGKFCLDFPDGTAFEQPLSNNKF